MKKAETYETAFVRVMSNQGVKIHQSYHLFLSNPLVLICHRHERRMVLHILSPIQAWPVHLVFYRLQDAAFRCTGPKDLKCLQTCLRLVARCVLGFAVINVVNAAQLHDLFVM